MGRGRVLAGLSLLLLLGAGAWLWITLTDDEALEPSTAPVTIVSGPGPDSQALAAGPGWELVVDSDEALHLVKEAGGGSSTRGYARPPILNEATAFAVPAASGVETVLAGPVSDEAAVVRAESAGGVVAQAEPVTVYELDWFLIRFDGRVAVAEIEALDVAGDAVDEYTYPTMPRPPRRLIRHGNSPPKA